MDYGDDTENELLNGAEGVTRTRKRMRELAERTSNGTRIRLYWLQGTRELWVEVWESELDVMIQIPADPERALEAFHHPYAYAAAYDALPLASEKHAAYRSGDPDGSERTLGR
jgi:hypothetical protein